MSSNPGLCGNCEHATIVRSAKGSEFTLCSLHKSFPDKFQKYPPVPVVICSGYMPSAKSTTNERTLFEDIGGRNAVGSWVSAFYDGAAKDPVIGHLFSADSSVPKQRQAEFLEQWLGGEKLYSQHSGHPRLRLRHFPFVIDEEAAERWLMLMEEALASIDAPLELTEKIINRLTPLAAHMVNSHELVDRTGPTTGWMD